MQYSELYEAVTDTAPLYHATSIDKACQILQSNSIIGNTSHFVELLYPETPKENGSGSVGRKKGVSLTRDKRFAADWGEVVFVLDQRLLKQNYKFKKVNFNSWNSTSAEFKNEIRDESEEFILGDIKNLNKYIVAIYFSKSKYNTADAEKGILFSEESWNCIRNYPKFAITQPKISSLKEWGRIVKGVNTTQDVDVNHNISIAQKLGFKVNRDGYAPILPTNGKISYKVRKNKPLAESKSTFVVVVDVQPEYSGINDGNENQIFQDIIDFVDKQTGQILMLCNAEDQGLSGDTVTDIKLYWEDSGFNEDKWNRVEIIDKGYGFLRSFMDQGISDSAIIKLIRAMYQYKVTDSRDLDLEVLKNCMSNEYKDWMEDGDAISVEWLSIAKLKKYNNCYLIGGSRNECLKEVTLLMNAFNIKYKLINELVYG